MKFFGKAQAALEFLTTYAWAFLVIIILIAALAYFGILSPSKLLPERCNFGAEISCMEYVIAENGAQLKLKNNVGSTIIVDSLAVSNKKVQLSCSSSIVGAAWESSDIKDVPIVCDFTGAGVVGGEKEKLSLEIKYHNAMAGSTFSKSVQGEVFAVARSGIVQAGGGVGSVASCKDILDKGLSTGDGSYIIDPDGSGGNAPFQVYCDMTTGGGGWTLAAKFTNQDSKNWVNIKSSWTDTTFYGNTNNLLTGTDAKSKAWGAIAANEFLFTDNLNLGKYVITTSNCIGGKTLSQFFTESLANYPNTASLNYYKKCAISKTYVPNWGTEPDWSGNGPGSSNLAVNNGHILIASTDSTDTSGVISDYKEGYGEADVGLAPNENVGFGTYGSAQDIGGPTSCGYTDAECRTEYPETVFLFIK